MKTVLNYVALALAGALMMTTADARELRLGPGAPPAHPAHTPLYSSFVEFLPQETNGEITGRIFGTEVANIGNMKTALQSMVVEAGNLLPLYFPGDLPNSALTGDLALLGNDSYVMGAAVTEYIVTCGDCQTEYKRMGTVYAGSGSSDVYLLLTTKPVRTEADLKGLRLRSGGAPYARWAESVGAIAVNVPVSDTFESMSQGVIDGTMASISDLVSYRLIDLVKYATELPLGTYHTTSNFSIANRTWTELTPDQRRGVIRAANRANVLFTKSWGYDRPESTRQKAKEAGIEFIEADQAMLSQKDGFIQSDIASATKLAQDKLGIADADVKIARFQELITKWSGIIEPFNGDADAITQAIQREVWDKIDYDSYGL